MQTNRKTLQRLNSQVQLAENPTISLGLVEHAYRYAEQNELPAKEATYQLIKVFYSGYGFYQQPNNSHAIAKTKEDESLNRFTKFIQKTTAFEDKPEYALFHYAQTIHEQTGKVVAEFPNAKGLGIEKDGNTRSTEHGEYCVA
ncbi:MAG: hypothetical protein ACJAVI_004375 [Candidatus Azotimanducaceae bacterium]|jgi:hypothetical protein